MIKDNFVKNIVSLLIEGDMSQELLQKQLELLEESRYEYTSAGLIIPFSQMDGISQYRTHSSKVLNGVLISSSELACGADTNLFFDKGFISYLEIFSRSSVYPLHPLRDYQLSRVWVQTGRYEG
ncbi:hypothetical protein JMG10_02590 [Nostoc ellipsosporum NOK]|nr:hypothetical protein [Nostoc ellipsosporum NOK]